MKYTKKDLERLLTSPDETPLSVLGERYVGSLLAGEGIARAVMLLTDQRLYVRGRVLTNAQGKLTWITRDSVVNAEDINASHVTTHKFPLGWPLLILGLILLLVLVFRQASLFYSYHGLHAQN